jgi:hypothetical protein
MFESPTDIVTAGAAAAAVAYLFFEITRRQRKLRDLIDVLDSEDAALTLDLEGLVRTGALRPLTASGAA